MGEKEGNLLPMVTNRLRFFLFQLQQLALNYQHANMIIMSLFNDILR